MIRCYTIHDGTVREGIALKDGHILVGEAGRGRHQIRVPVRQGTVNERGVLVAIPKPSRSPDAAALVLIRDQSGYRGSWELLSDSLEPCQPRSLGLLIAEGRAAQGEAGRAGGGPEYLLALPPVTFCIHRLGRLYGAPALLRVEVTADGHVAISDLLADRDSAAAADLLA